MHLFLRTLVLWACHVLIFWPASAQLAQGNLLVLQSGDGSAALSSAATPIILKEFLPGAASQTAARTVIPIPQQGTARLLVSGSSSSEGQLSLSADSSLLLIAGYDAAPGATSPGQSGATAVNRVVDTLNFLGQSGRAASTGNQYSSGSFRSAAGDGFGHYWGAGSNSGTCLVGVAGGTIQNAVANSRVVQAMNGKLYFSTTSGTAGIYRFGSYPAGATQAALMIPTGSGSAPVGFSINAAETVAYVADDHSSGGGIQKWMLGTAGWALAYTLSVGSGARGLAVDFSGTFAVCYAISTDNRLVRVIDSGATAAPVVLATAPSNTAFRSVSFVPKIPCGIPRLAALVQARDCFRDGAIDVQHRGGSLPEQYAWSGPGGFFASSAQIAGLQPGTYRLAATTAGGCRLDTSILVADQAALHVRIPLASPLSLCMGDSIAVWISGGMDGCHYQWKRNDSVLAAALTDSIYAGCGGTYKVIASAPNCRDSATLQISERMLPAVQGMVRSVGCSRPGCIVLQVSGADSPFVYRWSGPFGYASADRDADSLIPGHYSVQVRSVYGCATAYAADVADSASVHIQVGTDGHNPLCAGDSVRISVVPDTLDTYIWKRDGNLLPASRAAIVARIPGNYTVLAGDSSCLVHGPSVRVDTFPGTVPSVQRQDSLLLTDSFAAYQWFRNGVVLAGDTAQQLPLHYDGDYYVQVLDRNACYGRSAIIYIHNLQVTELPGQNWKVYPNPVTDVLYVFGMQVQEGTITDASGRIVRRFYTTQVYVGDLLPAQYTIRIKSGSSKDCARQILVVK